MKLQTSSDNYDSLFTKLPKIAGLMDKVPVTIKIRLFTVQANICDDSVAVQERLNDIDPVL